MTPLYNGQENHYKRMLDLQEKLRKSEEERIRLEERFNLLVQESKNRHQACINTLRIRYVEYLEEQRIRNERNNKLLGALEKVDSSLASLAAKTEKLSLVRKQYEAYLLRAYGQPRSNGSVTIDSGVDSQHDREISPSPVSSKSTHIIPKSSLKFFKANPEFDQWSRKLIGLDDQSTEKFKCLNEKPAEMGTSLKLQLSPASAAPSLYRDLNDTSKYPYCLPSNLNETRKYATIAKTETEMVANTFSFPMNSAGTRLEENRDLDGYISKIKRLHKDLAQSISQEREHSVEEADHEQNTSGDLLNMTLSEDGYELTAEEKAKTENNRARSSWLSLTRSAGPHATAEYCEKPGVVENVARVPVAEKRNESLGRKELLYGFSTSAIDNFSKPEIAAHASERVAEVFAQQPLSQDKRVNLDESRGLIQQNRNLLATDSALLTDAQQSAQFDDSMDHEFKDEADECIEDDYDHTVDIDSWMPDDVEQEVEETRVQDDIRDRPRRKLESIEEVEQPEDEDSADEVKDIPFVHRDEEHNSPVSSNNHVYAEEIQEAETCQEQQPDYSSGVYAGDAIESYPNEQQYCEQDVDEKQNCEEKVEYAENYEEPREGEQHYQYQGDSNQQYSYDENGQYTGYENQEYLQDDYGNYVDGQYQGYDPSQPYEQDLNQGYQHYESNPSQHEYGDYGQGEQYESTSRTGENEQNLSYEPKGIYDYSDEAQAYNTGVTGHESDNSVVERNQEQFDERHSVGEQLDLGQEDNVGAAVQEPKEHSKEHSNDNKRKKDVINSILDSDSESLIERNASKTDSDFDFN